MEETEKRIKMLEEALEKSKAQTNYFKGLCFTYMTELGKAHKGINRLRNKIFKMKLRLEGLNSVKPRPLGEIYKEEKL